MDGAAIAGIAAGIPTATFAVSTILIVFKIGRWQGTNDRIIKNHEEWIKGQADRCKDQKDSCGKRFDYIQGRVDTAHEEKGR